MDLLRKGWRVKVMSDAVKRYAGASGEDLAMA